MIGYDSSLINKTIRLLEEPFGRPILYHDTMVRIGEDDRIR